MHKQDEKIKLSISIMVSNSIDTIEKCMESLVPVLEKMPSELIIVDTGGTDGSINIAEKYADKIVKFEWCNDFAKARNAGLEKARGEWFLFLDDDEWFEDPSEIIEFFNSDEYLKYRSASYIIRNYSDMSGKVWHDIRSYRMAKIEKNTKFVSPIHEMLSPVYYPEKVLSCYLHHYGYVYKNNAEMRKHGLRNISVLNKVLEENPQDYRLWLQLAQEYRSIDEIQLSEDVSIKTIASIKSFGNLSNYNKKMLGWLLHNIIGMEIIKQDYEQAYQYAKEYIKYNWINNITKNNLAYRLVTLCFELKKYEECLTYLPVYEKTYKCLMESLQLRREEVVLDQEELLTEKHLSEIYVTGIRALFHLGQSVKVKNYFDKLLKLEPQSRDNKELTDILKYLLQEEKWSNRNRILTYLFKKEENRKIIGNIIESDSWEENEQEKLIVMLATMKADLDDTLQYRIIVGFKKEKNEELEKKIEEYIRNKDNILETVYPLLLIIKELKIDMFKYIEEKKLAVWVEQVNTFVVYAAEKKIDIFLEILKNISRYSFKINTLKMRCIEKKMRSDTIKNVSYKELIEKGKAYSELVYDVYQTLYQREAFYNEYSALLPRECRFAIKINKLLNEDISEVEAAKLMKEGTDIYPEMAAYCKTFILKIKEEVNNKAAEYREFQQLGNLIKEKIYGFIHQGAYSAAEQTLVQLEMLVPNDPEIKELKELILIHGRE